MERYSCKTYLRVAFEFDREANQQLLASRTRACTPEQLGITCKNEVEAVLKSITDDIIWNRHHFEIGVNTDFDIDINNMIRRTLKDFFGHEELLRDLQREYGVTVYLNLVPVIESNSDKPHQLLSLDGDIIAFLYKSGTLMDLDYYIV